MEAIFADGLPDDLTQESLHEICERYAAKGDVAEHEARGPVDGSPAGGEGASGYGGETGGVAHVPPRIRASQAIRVTLHVFRGAFIGSVEFARRALSQLPDGFPAPGTRSARMCSALLWEVPPARAA